MHIGVFDFGGMLCRNKLAYCVVVVLLLVVVACTKKNCPRYSKDRPVDVQ